MPFADIYRISDRTGVGTKSEIGHRFCRSVAHITICCSPFISLFEAGTVYYYLVIGTAICRKLICRKGLRINQNVRNLFNSVVKTVSIVLNVKNEL